MLLLHGISSSADYYGPSISLLARSFRVLGLDLLGFGESDKPRTIPYTLQLYADLIHEFLRKTDAAAHGEVYGTGHSMGGKYLLATAPLYPGTFKKMVLSNTDGFIVLPSFARALSLPGGRHVLKPLVTGERRIAGKMLDVAIHNQPAGHRRWNVPQSTPDCARPRCLRDRHEPEPRHAKARPEAHRPASEAPGTETTRTDHLGRSGPIHLAKNCPHREERATSCKAGHLPGVRPLSDARISGTVQHSNHGIHSPGTTIALTCYAHYI
ncbi:alpha/beta hydrolase [Chlorobaculum sp. MV4-Y]|nr:alpha/beta hydrolase [Chlorobaculum sp. MV4-Y]UWX58725.1 alpha/beta hydrolase [Chlorobaculum sp. MV4-Y]